MCQQVRVGLLHDSPHLLTVSYVIASATFRHRTYVTAKRRHLDIVTDSNCRVSSRRQQPTSPAVNDVLSVGLVLDVLHGHWQILLDNP